MPIRSVLIILWPMRATGASFACSTASEPQTACGVVSVVDELTSHMFSALELWRPPCHLCKKSRRCTGSGCVPGEQGRHILGELKHWKHLTRRLIKFARYR